eukprot:6174988-Pleurochrysis_carterae.AAC.2
MLAYVNVLEAGWAASSPIGRARLHMQKGKLNTDWKPIFRACFNRNRVAKEGGPRAPTEQNGFARLSKHR